MKKARYQLPILLIVLFLAAFMYGQNTTKITYKKFTPEELAIRDLISKNLGFFMRMHDSYEANLKKYNYHKNNDSPIRTNWYSSRATSNIRVVHNYLKGMRSSNRKHTLLIPKAMMPLFRELGKVERSRFDINPKNMTNSDYNLLVSALRDLCTIDRRTASIINERPSSFSFGDYQANLSLEVGKLPFKIDISSGSIKIKGSMRIGPLKGTMVLGNHPRTGIKTLILRKGIYERRFAVGHRPIFMDIPESYLETSGDVMIITAKETNIAWKN